MGACVQIYESFNNFRIKCRDLNWYCNVEKCNDQKDICIHNGRYVATKIYPIERKNSLNKRSSILPKEPITVTNYMEINKYYLPISYIKH